MELDDTLNQMADDFWDLVQKGAKIYGRADSSVKVHKKKDAFKKTYVDLYKEISAKYMKNFKEPLDRHKVAAILIISVIKADILSVKENTERFTGNYALAVEVGLNYMMDELNRRLQKKGQRTLESYNFPTPWTCDTPYYRIFYRNLYYADKNEKWGLNPLDIAEKLFLLEYITLLKNDIDPEILQEKH